MSLARSPRRFLAAAALLAGFVALAVAARWLLEDRFPLERSEWWRPVAAPPAIDPQVLARIARVRQAQAGELAQRRQRVRPVPARLQGGVAVPQTGHFDDITALAWLGTDVVTAGKDDTLRVWRPALPRPLLVLSVPLPPGARALAADAKSSRVWVALDPDLLLVRSGASLELEERRWMPGAAATLGLALADGGTRAVLLVRQRAPSAAPPAFAVRHVLAGGLVLLKEVPLGATGEIRSAALSPDGSTVALLVRQATGLLLELLRADDGTPRNSTPFVAPWWPAGVSPPDEAPTLVFGRDFLVYDDTAGTAVIDVRTDGTLGPPAPWPHDRLPAADRFAAACPDRAAIGSRGRGWWFLRRTPAGWAQIPGGSDACSVLACAPDAETWALARGPRLEIHAPGGSAIVDRWSVFAGVVFDEASSSVRVLRRLPAGSGDSSEEFILDLGAFRVTRRDPGGAIHEVAPNGGRIVEASPDGEFTLQSPDGAVLGHWTCPPWLASPPASRARFSLSRDGQRVVLAGEGGFAVFAPGQPEPVLDFSGEGYEDAPADFSPGNRTLAIARDDGTVELWDAAGQVVERSFPVFNPQGGRPTILRYGRDGETLFVGGSRGSLAAVNADTGNVAWAGVPHEGPVSVVVPADGADWVVTSDLRSVAVSSRKTGATLVAWIVAPDGGWAVMTPDGYHIADGPGGESLVVLRRSITTAAPDRLPADMFGPPDPDVAALGNAVDALRVTLLGGTEEGGRQ